MMTEWCHEDYRRKQEVAAVGGEYDPYTGLTTIHFLVGEKHIEPVRYVVAGGCVHGPWWKFWAPREEWSIVSDFMTIGPFKSYAEAEKLAQALRAMQ